MDVCPLCLEDVVADERYHTPCMQCAWCQAFVHTGDAAAHRCAGAELAQGAPPATALRGELQAAVEPFARYAAARLAEQDADAEPRAPAHATAAVAVRPPLEAPGPPRPIHRKRSEVEAILAARAARAARAAAAAAVEPPTAATPPPTEAPRQRRPYDWRVRPEDASAEAKQEGTDEVPRVRRAYRKRVRPEDVSAEAKQEGMKVEELTDSGATTREASRTPASEETPSRPRRIHRKRSEVEAILAGRAARAARAAAAAALEPPTADTPGRPYHGEVPSRPRRINRKNSEVDAIMAARAARSATAAPAVAAQPTKEPHRDAVKEAVPPVRSAAGATGAPGGAGPGGAPPSWQLRITAVSAEAVAELSRVERDMQQTLRRCPVEAEGGALAVCTARLGTRLSAEKWAERARELGLLASVRLC
ncbi:mucin-associated surface protein (MASP) [Strigomonas culicis]|uniref:Mucin-associated surface protein (MASP) n=1 Tax=Strigomonas culicis TaxID=28005 RepID=S9UKU4_9TRYP|nr:mucin-associated surface protein (MASP) [Strigomonas culicis]|eukprot:EPY15296.1 mucin-associated surface protein (MASP) [Strigomonas culicis]